MYGQYGIFLLKNIHGADIDAFAALYAGADIKKYYFVVCYLVLFFTKICVCVCRLVPAWLMRCVLRIPAVARLF